MVVDILQVCCAFQKMIYPYVSIRAMVKTWHTGKPWSSTILKGNTSAIPPCGYIIQSLIMVHMDDMPISSQIYIDLLYLSIFNHWMPMSLPNPSFAPENPTFQDCFPTFKCGIFHHTSNPNLLTMFYIRHVFVIQCPMFLQVH